MKIIRIIVLGLILASSGCVEPKDELPTLADCENGYIPCAEDSTVCCEVTCPPGYYLGGQDSTECLSIECPPGYYLGGEDSTECLEVICPPGYYLAGPDSIECLAIECPPGYALGGPDSTDCIEVICEEHYHPCGPNLAECCIDSVLYGGYEPGDTLMYVVTYWRSASGFLADYNGIETWIINSSPNDENIILITAHAEGTYSWGWGDEPTSEHKSVDVEGVLDKLTGRFGSPSGGPGWSIFGRILARLCQDLQYYEAIDRDMSFPGLLGPYGMDSTHVEFGGTLFPEPYSEGVYGYGYRLNMTSGIEYLQFDYINGMYGDLFRWTMDLIE
ncbi:MAG: hypothetical protein H8E18_04750 [FCB group bacterium]|nr:hypothetical protein [FCB group bacterium]